MVHITTEDIIHTYRQIRDGEKDYSSRVPKFWDGKAAERIAKIITGFK